MTEENNNKDSKKRQLFPIKFVLLIALAVFGYFAFKSWYIAKNHKIKATTEISKNDNHDIFDFSDEYKSGVENYDLSDMTVNEMKEKGVEFVYQLLLKNQVQINDLKQQAKELNEEFLKYKSHEKLGKIIFSYIELRQKIFSGQQYSESLKNLEMLIFADEKLQNKITKIKPLLNDFLTQEKLEKAFATIIPTIIADKGNSGQDQTFLKKIRHYIATLIVIRRIDGKVENDVDGIIVKIEKFLREENYQEALTSALLLDQKYHATLVDFLNKLTVAIEVQKIDQDILNHLKSLN